MLALGQFNLKFQFWNQDIFYKNCSSFETDKNNRIASQALKHITLVSWFLCLNFILYCAKFMLIVLIPIFVTLVSSFSLISQKNIWASAWNCQVKIWSLQTGGFKEYSSHIRLPTSTYQAHTHAVPSLPNWLSKKTP